ncbi:hypothetical protein QVD17_09801 [Tagetes erecta]|uniref:tRNA/rRNA methyltransferase SpoU type domain-containing protein n=1 Tax=Tagetes erecta TaxID=13708 RepID=A0AAD8L1L4_TARER|nr:hypothetical protein QVD17_09801 [Tagetes erecta]
MRVILHAERDIEREKALSTRILNQIRIHSNTLGTISKIPFLSSPLSLLWRHHHHHRSVAVYPPSPSSSSPATTHINMSTSKFLFRYSLSLLEFSTIRIETCTPSLHFPRHRLLSHTSGFKLKSYRQFSRSYGSVQAAVAVDVESSDDVEEDGVKPTVGDLIWRNTNDDVSSFMKMERRIEPCSSRWFPYLDRFKAGSRFLSSREVLDAVEPSLMELRKERFRNVVNNRTYSVCLVVEGLSDAGNVSAVFRSADALGFQSVHVVSLDSSKRYREHRHVSMGAEKWLDIELWDSTEKCFEVLKSRGYRIATTHLGMETVSVYDMDWSCPTAIVVGNEGRGISEEALKLSDMHCSIPMKGMVDSFNVSVASGILMHHAVCDRTKRLGGHGDLTSEEKQILLAEFSLRHSRSSISIAHEYAKRNVTASPKL